jgi:hypothetical protein
VKLSWDCGIQDPVMKKHRARGQQRRRAACLIGYRPSRSISRCGKDAAHDAAHGLVIPKWV